jgi:hypothetical protein
VRRDKCFGDIPRLAKGERDADAALASAAGCPTPPSR